MASLAYKLTDQDLPSYKRAQAYQWRRTGEGVNGANRDRARKAHIELQHHLTLLDRINIKIHVNVILLGEGRNPIGRNSDFLWDTHCEG